MTATVLRGDDDSLNLSLTLDISESLPEVPQGEEPPPSDEGAPRPRAGSPPPPPPTPSTAQPEERSVLPRETEELPGPPLEGPE
jgi:hypothetical protein